MKKVCVRGVVLGEGMPKICVPIVARNMDDAIKQAEAIAQLREGEERAADLVEWRADWLDGVNDPEKLLGTAAAIRRILPDMPVLFTFRTLKEGGEQALPEQEYLDVTIRAAQSGLIDLVDVELSAGDDGVQRVLDAAHLNGVSVICSNHDFHATPSKEEILLRLKRMEALGADILKIAVMPNTAQDVLTLLSATEEMSRHSSRPLITMSMSSMGVVSRLCGETFGSCLTFGAVGKASAPGQIGAGDLKKILKVIHG